VAEVLRQTGLRVFYDNFEQAELWGKDLYIHLDEIYQRRARYCVMFISKFYKQKLWTNHERESAQARAFSQNEEYILPARFDDTEIPGVRKTIGYIDLKGFEPYEFAKFIFSKINPYNQIDDMLQCLRDWLKNYDIFVRNDMVVFDCEIEDYHGEFPTSILLEMYRKDLLEEFFLHPAIVPW
jgi:hypothetical protein